MIRPLTEQIFILMEMPPIHFAEIGPFSLSEGSLAESPCGRNWRHKVFRFQIQRLSKLHIDIRYL